MLEDFPHTKKSICTLFSMPIVDSGNVMQDEGSPDASADIVCEAQHQRCAHYRADAPQDNECEDPLDFLARPAALVSKPRIDPARIHDVFTPNSR